MDHYDVLEVIGEGTYGVVFKCRDKRTNQIVAVKQFKNFQTNAYIRVTMQRELCVEQLLKGEPNVTQLLKTFQEKNRLHLVMEYIPRSLLDVLEEVRHGLREDSLVLLLFTILLGLRSCHRNGIIHRDLKPENILVSDDGVAFLCDFGFCRPLSQQLQPQHQPQPRKFPAFPKDIASSAASITGHSSVGSNSLSPLHNTQCTRSGTSLSSANSAILSELVLADHQAVMTNYVATRWYRSPEMLLGMPSYTYAVDMWAVGVIMAEAIDGEPLLPGKTELEQLSLIQARVGDFPKAYEAEVRKRNGGILSLCALNPLAAPPQGLHLKSTQPKARRSSGGVGHAPENAGVSQATGEGYLNERYGGRISKDGMNLLCRLLRVDAAERITVEEAIEHPYFDEMRGRFNATTNRAHALRSGIGISNEAAEMQSITGETAEQTTGPQMTSKPHQEFSSPVNTTGAVDSTLPSISLSCVADGSVSPAVEAAPIEGMGVQNSLVNEMSAGVDDVVGDSLSMASSTELSPRVMAIACMAPASTPATHALRPESSGNASPADSVSSSLWTASETSAKTALLPGLTKEGQVCSPHSHGVACAPIPMGPPNVSEAGGGYFCAGARNGAVEVRDLTSPSPPSLVLDKNGTANQPGPGRQDTVSDGANVRGVERDASYHTHCSSSATPFHSHRGHINSRDARRLPERTPYLESGARVTALTQTDIPTTSRLVQGSNGVVDAAEAAAAHDVNSSASPSSQKPRRTTKKSVCGFADARRHAGKGPSASVSRTKSLSSMLPPSCSTERVSLDQSKPLVGSLATTGVQSSSTHMRHTAREDHPEKLRHSSGALSAPRIKGSGCGEREKAAVNSESKCTHRSSCATTSTMQSVRGDTGGMASARQGQRFSSGRGHSGSTPHDIISARSRVKERTLANSCREAAQSLSDTPAQRRQGSIDSLPPPPPPRYCTRTPTLAVETTNDDSHRHGVRNPFLVRSSPEVPSSLPVSDVRAGDSGRRGSLRFASPQLPREVLPLPAGERVTLLKEIDSPGFSVSTPGAVEELLPVEVSPAARWPEHAVRDSDVEEEGQSRSQQCAKDSAVFRAEPVVPASKPPRLLGNEVPSCKSCGRGEVAPSAGLVERKRQCSEAASLHASVAKRHSAASRVTLALAERTTGRSPHGDGETQSHQQPPPPGDRISMRTPPMGQNSLAGTKTTSAASVTADNKSRAAPSLIFRSSRTVSSSLKLAAFHPPFSPNQGKSAPRELSINGLHTGPGANVGVPSLSSPNTSSSALTRRLAPALQRCYHLSSGAGSHSLHASTSLGTGPLLVSSALSPQSPDVAGCSALSPTFSQCTQQPNASDVQNTSMDAPMISLSGARHQRHLSDSPIELSPSAELFADSTAKGSRGACHREKITSLSTAPFSTTCDDLETVMLRETSPASRNVGAPRQEQGPIAEGWTPNHSPTPAIISTSLRDNPTPSQSPDREGDALPPSFEANGSVPTLDGSGIAAGATWYSTIPESLVATLSGDLDGVMNLRDAPAKTVPDSVDTHGIANNTSRLACARLGLSLAPPQPLLGGASVPSARQLHAGEGRKKSRLAL
ncbi:hypothetical protein JKF63_03475 [Porcisia hertigi]|uniref:cyclin-dependent kinase n=1 Tax=Porcisia hertigi TaxID=2761500 RepID=A0A836IQT4_9TRYP|nr:hypothetical protein JKF63_03475 [Porcisia hertigi]